MLKVNLTGDDVAGDARELAERLEDLSPTDAEIRDAVVRQNADVNFDPSHPRSLLEVNAGSGAIGTDSESYGKLLDVDVEELADIADAYIDGGGS